MLQPNIHEVREKLAEYLDAVARGEEVVICRRNQPLARLVAITRPPAEPRPIGGAPDAGTPLPDAFWEPLPQALVDALAGLEPGARVASRPGQAAQRPAKPRARQ